MNNLTSYFLAGWCICVVLLMSACSVSSSLSTDGVIANQSFPRELPKPEVVLSPGDSVEVKFRYWPELDTEQTIRPDGKIALQLVGQVQAAGLTPELLDARLTEVYRSQILNPEIVTIVRSLANQQIYVGGEVNKPGLIDLKPGMTVLEAVMAAGGFDTSSAELSNVVVVRHINNSRTVTAIDFKNALFENNDLLYLSARDIVYVPRTKIDQVNQWVDQYINKLIPDHIVRFVD